MGSNAYREQLGAWMGLEIVSELEIFYRNSGQKQELGLRFCQQGHHRFDRLLKFAAVKLHLADLVYD